MVTAPPSAIVAAIQATGRDPILRGTGSSNSELQGGFVDLTTTAKLDFKVLQSVFLRRMPRRYQTKFGDWREWSRLLLT